MRAAFACALFSCAPWLSGQFAALPQADSPDEFDAYLVVLDAHTPAAVIASGDAFCKAWPKSGLRGHVYELEFEAYRKLGDANNAIGAAEKSLAIAPDNLVVLANLAGVLANGTRDPKRLERAEAYARKVMALSKSFRVPRFIGPTEWDGMERRFNSQAHAALGLVASLRGNLREAVEEFEAAVALAPAPDASQLYRLGLLYRATGDMARARQKFQEAAALNDSGIKELAERELHR